MNYRKLISLSVILILTCATNLSCKKHSVIYDDLMWERLSDGNGIWEVERIEFFKVLEDNSIEVLTDESPTEHYYYFYTGLQDIVGVVIENDYLQKINYNSETGWYQPAGTYFFSRLAGGAENERITLELPAGGSYLTYTVVEGGKKKQIWERVTTGTTTFTVERITIRKCNNCKPVNLYFDIIETGG